MNDWQNKSRTGGGSKEPRKLPATAAVDQLTQSMRRGHTVQGSVAGRHRGSLDSAMKMQVRQRFDTGDLFSSLIGSDNCGFPEIKWCDVTEESESNGQRMSSSHGQLAGSTGPVVGGGGFHKTPTWPRR